MRIFLRLLFVLSLVFVLCDFYKSFTYAIYDPLSVPNNKYGIHVIDENDLENAASLVNSSNGRYGYVTIVIPEYERKVHKWKDIFNRLKNLELIPIVRIATNLEAGVWKIPKNTDVAEWVNFLGQLPWYTRNRYVVLFNEPNHAKEWGGRLDPQEYAHTLKVYSQALKENSHDFYILPAGLDASAPDGYETMEESRYISRMKKAIPDIFDYIDGWTSHSYPNPGFVGKVEQKGKGTLSTFVWELDFLATLGVEKPLPVFITETGWPHREGDQSASYYLSADLVSDLITKAAQTIWNDPRIVAVTPFVLNYQSYPFSHFSWQVLGAYDFHPQFDSYRSIPKQMGAPLLVITPIPSISPLQNSAISETNSIMEKKSGILRLLYQVFYNVKKAVS